MARYAACDKKLFPGGEVLDTLRRRAGIGPGPAGELVYEVVAREEELVGGELAGGAEGRGGGGGGVFAQFVEGRVKEVARHAGLCVRVCVGRGRGEMFAVGVWLREIRSTMLVW